MTLPVLTITSIGNRASQVFAQYHTGSVWGNTSKGVFLNFPPKTIIFLSNEPYRGPLTANLTGEVAFLQKISVGESVQIEAEKLIFERSGIRLEWHKAPIWEPSPLSNVPIQKKQIRMRCLELYQRVMTSRDIPSADESWWANGIFPTDLTLASLLPTLLPLLGRGSGLTPSGDDVILGCLLALSRWGRAMDPVLDIQEFSRELVTQAYQRTTLLSANLIEAAARGQADERLILALDGIFTGQLPIKQCADLILSWGNSSGSAALAGMCLAVTMI